MENLIYSLEEFQEENKTNFLQKIKSMLQAKGFDNKRPQISSWEDCFDFLKSYLPYNQLDPEIMIIFEYMLPLEGGKRPDVILLSNVKVLILEFKRKNKISSKDLEQAINYRKNIKNYHYETADNHLTVESYVVYTSDDVKPYKNHSIAILTAENFHEEIFNQLAGQSSFQNTDQWLNSIYQPLESLVKATKNLFDTGKLPQIKRIEESDVRDALTAIKNIINFDEGKKILSLLVVSLGQGKHS